MHMNNTKKDTYAYKCACACVCVSICVCVPTEGEQAVEMM